MSKQTKLQKRIEEKRAELAKELYFMRGVLIDAEKELDNGRCPNPHGALNELPRNAPLIMDICKELFLLESLSEEV